MIASAISQLWAARFACAILHPQTGMCKSGACPGTLHIAPLTSSLISIDQSHTQP